VTPKIRTAERERKRIPLQKNKFLVCDSGTRFFENIVSKLHTASQSSVYLYSQRSGQLLTTQWGFIKRIMQNDEMIVSVTTNTCIDCSIEIRSIGEHSLTWEDINESPTAQRLFVSFFTACTQEKCVLKTTKSSLHRYYALNSDMLSPVSSSKS